MTICLVETASCPARSVHHVAATLDDEALLVLAGVADEYPWSRVHVADVNLNSPTARLQSEVAFRPRSVPLLDIQCPAKGRRNYSDGLDRAGLF